MEACILATISWSGHESPLQIFPSQPPTRPDGPAHELNMTVIAEGAEDDATIAALTGLGWELIQGYAIARPPIDQIDRWLRARSVSMTAKTAMAVVRLPV